MDLPLALEDYSFFQAHKIVLPLVSDQWSLTIRLLYPQHLDGIWTGPLQFRLPYDTLSELPEPWF